MAEASSQKVTFRCVYAQPWTEADVADDGELRTQYDLMVSIDGQAAGEVSGYHFARNGRVHNRDADRTSGLPEVFYVAGHGSLVIRSCDMYDGDCEGIPLPNYEPGNGTITRLEHVIKRAAIQADHGELPADALKS